MKAVVTGGAGFVGSALARALLERGDDVLVIDNFANAGPDDVPEGARVASVDIRDLPALETSLHDAEVVWHQAAIRSVPRSLVEPSFVHDNNATGTLNVLLAAERTGVKRVIYASSSSVYGGVVDGKSNEAMAPHPLSPYGVSKLAGEYYCSVWASLGRVEAVSLRYFNVFGPGQKADSKYAAVFPSFISALMDRRSPEIHGDGEQSRDFTYIDDVVRANLMAAAAEQDAIGSVINVAPGSPRTINAVFDEVSRSLGSNIEPSRVAERAGDIRHSYADNELARRLLGWEAVTDWQEAVSATVRWFADHESERSVQ